ncbi:Dnaj homolog subfamily b member 8 [Phtheirospermum japonicum]|uniref:Dnaj homolog subfamily b member 8 n=1 Tax=Phtheirospermum japonicum TaxID=374723 RepID=A0A830BTT4_9LAMI|nr:Dnaj homolog subfamily b member 8 [Phtheirospermum japonicum]
MEYSKRWPCYYGVLGVELCSSDDEIRHAYRKMAMQWHPDKWTRSPSLLDEAKEKFQQIQEAYSVLSDRTKRTMYDAGMFDADDEEDEPEGFSDFLQEMESLVDDVRRKEKSYSFGELQSMFRDMAQGFEIPELNTLESMTRNSCEGSIIGGNEHLSKSGFEANFMGSSINSTDVNTLNWVLL